MTGTTSLGFVYPTDPDPMCAAPGLPAKTALRVLAESIQAWITAQDLDDQIAASVNGVHRAQVARLAAPTTANVSAMGFDTVAFNYETDTDLSVWSEGPIPSDGAWLVIAEVVVEKSTTMPQGYIFTQVVGSTNFAVYSDAAATSEPAGGGAQAAGLLASYAPIYPPMEFGLTGPAAASPNIRYMTAAIVRIAEFI